MTPRSLKKGAVFLLLESIAIEAVLKVEDSPCEHIMIGERRNGTVRCEAGRVAHKRIIKRPA